MPHVLIYIGKFSKQVGSESYDLLDQYIQVSLNTIFSIYEFDSLRKLEKKYCINTIIVAPLKVVSTKLSKMVKLISRQNVGGELTNAFAKTTRKYLYYKPFVEQNSLLKKIALFLF